ncbi:MAG: ABC transporter substrate-binding protein [Ilumatobacteraceae bacterium]
MAVSSRIRIVGALTITAALLAAGCSKKDTGTESGPDTTAVSVETTTSATDVTTPETTPEAKPVPGGTLLVSGESEVANAWTPAAMQCDAYCHQRARTFFEPLTAYGSDMTTHNVLAESVEPNADFTQWTVKARPNITFHDGTPFNADAIISNLQKAGTSLLIANALKDVAKNPDSSLKIDKVDDMTVTIFTGRNGDVNTPVPWPGFPRALGTQWGLMASPTWLDAVAAGTGDPTMAVGTGPFIVESYAPRDKLVVVKNPTYWQKDADGNQLPHLDKIEFRVIEDPSTALQALRSGDIDIFTTGYSDVIGQVRDNPDGLESTERNQFVSSTYLLIDLDKPGPLQDKRVRCALSKALDRQELIDLTAAGLPPVANGLFSPGQEGYLEDNGFDTSQDLAGAQALIDEYTAETGQQVVVPLGTTVAQINAQSAELMKGYWAQIGVETTIAQVPQDQYITNALFGSPDFTMYQWANHAGVEADEQAYWWSSDTAAPDGQLALNFGRIRDEQVDAGLRQARSGLTAEERRAGAEQVNRRFAEECYQIPLSWNLNATIRKPKVLGIEAALLPDGVPANTTTGLIWMQGVWIDPDA